MIYRSCSSSNIKLVYTRDANCAHGMVFPLQGLKAMAPVSSHGAPKIVHLCQGLTASIPGMIMGSTFNVQTKKK